MALVVDEVGLVWAWAWALDKVKGLKGSDPSSLTGEEQEDKALTNGMDLTTTATMQADQVFKADAHH